MKKNLTLVVAVLTIAAVTTSAMAVVLYENGFENVTVGTQITEANWSYTGTSATNGLATTAQAIEGSQSMYFDRSDAAWALRNYNVNYLTEGIMSFSFRLKEDGTANRLDVIFIDRDSAMSIRMNFFSDYGIYDRINAQTLSTTLITTDVWHDVALQFDYDDTSQGGTGSVGVFLDNQYIATAKINTTATEAHYGIASGVYGGNLYIDDYKVSAIPEPSMVTFIGLGLLSLLRKRTR
jgi:hypothetical protein